MYPAPWQIFIFSYVTSPSLPLVSVCVCGCVCGGVVWCGVFALGRARVYGVLCCVVVWCVLFVRACIRTYMSVYRMVSWQRIKRLFALHTGSEPITVAAIYDDRQIAPAYAVADGPAAAAVAVSTAACFPIPGQCACHRST